MKKNKLIIIGIICLILGIGIGVDSVFVNMQSKKVFEQWYQNGDFNDKTLFNKAQGEYKLSKDLLPIGVGIGAIGFILIYGGIYQRRQNPYDD